MRVARDNNGKLLFVPEEWRTEKQISSYFSRLAAAQRSREAHELPVEETEKIDDEDVSMGSRETAPRTAQSNL